jgi:hypothetical protein
MCNGSNRGFERCRDLSSQVSPQATIFRVTKERWAQIGITTEFLIVVRTLGEFFWLRHALGTNFSTAVATPYVGGGLIAACSCWVAVTLYFFRRYTLSAWIALATVVSSRSADSVETRADQAGQLSGMAIYHQSAGGQSGSHPHCGTDFHAAIHSECRAQKYAAKHKSMAGQHTP